MIIKLGDMITEIEEELVNNQHRYCNRENRCAAEIDTIL